MNQIDVVPEKDQEYQAVRIFGKDSMLVYLNMLISTTTMLVSTTTRRAGGS